MSINRRKISAILIVASMLCGWPIGSQGRSPSPEDPLQQGVVVGPDNKPIAGAKVYWFAKGMVDAVPADPIAITDAEGKYRFNAAVPTRPANLFADRYWGDDAPGLMATAEGFGLGFAPAHPRLATTVVLVKDDVPMTGRVLDQATSKPVVGAKVRGLLLLAPGTGKSWERLWPMTKPGPSSLEPWLDALKKADDYSAIRNANDLMTSVPLHRTDVFERLHPPAVTGDDGRFRIDGIGRDRVLMARIEGPGIESKVVFLATRATDRPSVEPIWRDSTGGFRAENPDLIYGPGFDHLARPGRTIEGTVRDLDSDRPMPGALVQTDRKTLLQESFQDWQALGFFQSTTDAAGRYRIEGFPDGSTYKLKARSSPDDPYPSLTREAKLGAGQGPVTLDFPLKRGVWLTGRVLDRATGQPPSYANVSVYLDPENPNLPKIAGVCTLSFEDQRVGDDGRFRIATLPGPGLIAASTSEAIFAKGIGLDRVEGDRWFARNQSLFRMFEMYTDRVSPEQVNTVVLIDPPVGAGPTDVALFLERGGSRLVKVVGPDGQPAKGLRIEDRNRLVRKEIGGSEFTVLGLGRGVATVVIRQDAEKRIGSVDIAEAEGPPITATLQPWASLAGRLVDAEGRPIKGTVRFEGKGVSFPFVKNEKGSMPPDFAIDGDGRFLVEGLLPGFPYNLRFRVDLDRGIVPPVRNLILNPGEARDLGEIRTTPLRSGRKR